MSFQRQISTGVDSPRPRQPVQTGSDIQDIASLATAASGIYKMIKEEEAEANKKASDDRIANASLSAFEMIEDMKAANGSVSTQDLLSIENRVLSTLADPMEKLALKESLGKYLGNDWGKAVIGSDLTQVDTMREELRSRDEVILFQAQTVAGYGDVDFNDLDEEALEKVEQAYNQIAFDQAEAEKAISELSETPTADNFGLAIAAVSGKNMNLLSSEMNTILLDLERLDKNSPEYKERIMEVKAGAVNLLGNEINMINQIFESHIAKNPRISDEDLALAIKKKDQAIKLRQDQINTWNSMSEQMIEKSTKLSKSLSDARKVELSHVAPYLLAIAEVLPESTASALIDQALWQLQGGKDIIIDRTSVQLEQTLGLRSLNTDINIGAVASASGKMSLASVHHMVSGKSLDDLSAEDRAQMAADNWATISAYLSRPEDVAIMAQDERLADNFGLAAIEVLKLAEEQGTREDMKRASKLLGSDTFKAYMDILPEAERKVLGKYVASSVSAKLVDQFRADNSLQYNVSSGKIESRLHEKTKGQPAVRGRSANAKRIVAGQSKRDAQVADKQLYNAAEIVASSNDFFEGDVKRAKEYLISLVSPSQIEGTIENFSDTAEAPKRSAIENGIKIEQQLEYLNRDQAYRDQIESLEGRLKEAQEGQLSADQILALPEEVILEMRAKRIQNSQMDLDLNDETVE